MFCRGMFYRGNLLQRAMANPQIAKSFPCLDKLKHSSPSLLKQVMFLRGNVLDNGTFCMRNILWKGRSVGGAFYRRNVLDKASRRIKLAFKIHV